MISVLTQERLLGAALGSVLAGVVVLEERRNIYRSISENQSQSALRSRVKESVFGKKAHLEYAHLWNKAVDEMFGPLIESLSSRGW